MASKLTSKYLPSKLDKKYAKLWNQTCGWKIPRSLKPFRITGKLTRRENDLYAGACWKVLNMMAQDGLISRDALRYWHNKENGWKNWSTIDEGYVPKDSI